MAGKTSVFCICYFWVFPYTARTRLSIGLALAFFSFCNHTCYGQCCKAQQHHHTPQRRFPGITGLRRTAARRELLRRCTLSTVGPGLVRGIRILSATAVRTTGTARSIRTGRIVGAGTSRTVRTAVSPGLVGFFFLRWEHRHNSPAQINKIVDGIILRYLAVSADKTLFYRSTEKSTLFCAFCNSS